MAKTPGPPDDRETPKPAVLLARGEISLRDRQIIKTLLGRLGVHSFRFMTEEQFKELTDPKVVVVREKAESTPRYWDLDGIRSRKTFVLREHVDDFRVRFTPDTGKETATRAFNHLVDGQAGNSNIFGWHWEGDERVPWSREPRPPDGVVVATRSELEAPPYLGKFEIYGKTNDTAMFGVQAGSIIDYATHYDDVFQRLNARDGFILRLARRLDAQIEAP